MEFENADDFSQLLNNYQNAAAALKNKVCNLFYLYLCSQISRRLQFFSPYLSNDFVPKRKNLLVQDDVQMKSKPHHKNAFGQTGNGSHKCMTCDFSFRSREMLFDHLRLVCRDGHIVNMLFLEAAWYILHAVRN